MAYTLDSDPCGHCLIINNVNFCPSSGLGTRTGSNLDRDKLEHRFRWLRFMVEVKNDLTAKKMVTALMEMAHRNHRALDCFVVVILSHGCQASHLQFPGAVYGTDGCSVSIEKIVNIFNGSGCPSLGGKPKLFFIQACGGGFVSWRDKKSGSWYIETLDGILEQWARSEDLQSLLLRVANAVSAKGTYKQIPGCFNFLRKKLFFKTS